MHKNSSWDHVSSWKIDYLCPCHFIAVRRIRAPNLTWRWHYTRKNHFPFLWRGLLYKLWTSFSTFRYTLFLFDWSLSSSSRQVIIMNTKSLFISAQCPVQWLKILFSLSSSLSTFSFTSGMISIYFSGALHFLTSSLFSMYYCVAASFKFSIKAVLFYLHYTT